MNLSSIEDKNIEELSDDHIQGIKYELDDLEVIYVKKDGKWGEYKSWFIIDGINSFITLNPDDSIGTLTGLPYFYVDSLKVPGEYRFNYSAYSDKEFKNLLPTNMCTSESFFIHN